MKEVSLGGLLAKNMPSLLLSRKVVVGKVFSVQIKLVDVHISFVISWPGLVRALQDKESYPQADITSDPWPCPLPSPVLTPGPSSLGPWEKQHQIEVKSSGSGVRWV